jgi:hypothetical protein
MQDFSCLCEKSILEPKTKGSGPTHLEPHLLPLPEINS